MESSSTSEKRQENFGGLAVLEVTLCPSSKAGIGRRDVKSSSDKAL